MANILSKSELTTIPNTFRIYGVKSPYSETDDHWAAMASVRQWPVEAPASPHTLTAADCGKVITNEGAGALLAINLGDMAAGFVIRFMVQDANGIQLTAIAGDTIQIGDLVSSGGGTCTSTAKGSSLTLVKINTSEWFAESMLGSFTLA